MSANTDVPGSVGGHFSDGGTNTSAGSVAGGQRDRREVEKCGTCGHTATDHAEGFIGASVSGTPYCHVDDHTCYVTASWRAAQSVHVRRHSPGHFDGDGCTFPSPGHFDHSRPVAASPVSDTEETR